MTKFSDKANTFQKNKYSCNNILSLTSGAHFGLYCLFTFCFACKIICKTCRRCPPCRKGMFRGIIVLLYLYANFYEFQKIRWKFSIVELYNLSKHLTKKHTQAILVVEFFPIKISKKKVISKNWYPPVSVNDEFSELGKLHAAVERGDIETTIAIIRNKPPLIKLEHVYSLG